MCDLVRRHSLVPKPCYRRQIGHPGKPTTRIAAPNAVWTADFTGPLKTGDGLYCSPLTVADGSSRVLLGCQALSSTRVQEAKPVFVRLCKDFGVPTRLRTDNGVPFAPNTLARWSQLSAWWVRRGILPAFIAPGQPQPNGRHERRHRTLNVDTTRPPAKPRRAQQYTCDPCRQEFHCARPHEALDRPPPASRSASSPRQLPDKRPPREDPDRFEVRDVSANGGIRWNRPLVTVSICCAGEYGGLEELDEGVCNVSFGPLTRGRLLERQRRIEEASGRLNRRRCL